MSNENDKIENMFDRRNPFTVPEGYFENFASSLMESLPDNKHQVLHVRVSKTRRAIYAWSSLAAACVIGLLFTLITIFKQNKSDMASALSKNDNVGALTGLGGNQSELDMMADYLMIDNEDIYAYASEY